VGKKPTFDGAELTVEAFLLDFDETVYDQAIALSFIGWVRGQRKFDSAKDLQAQISEDVEQVQRICRETEQS
jgi:riboflavin kinase/FMN adenylyltransferase